MALSKLVIGLIATIGSVAAVGGIAAGVVVSKQNSTQVIEPSSDKKNPDDKPEGKPEISSKEENEKRISNQLEMMHGDDPLVSSEKDKSSKGDEEELKKKAEQEKSLKDEKEETEQERKEALSTPQQAGLTPAKDVPKIKEGEGLPKQNTEKQNGDDLKTHEETALGHVDNQSPDSSDTQDHSTQPTLLKEPGGDTTPEENVAHMEVIEVPQK